MIGRKLRKRYEIREHLGDGSTATVYKAFDERLGRDVAIKMLLPHVRETTRKRFFQEATAAAQLNHPNIMSIYDIDEDNGRNFLVVEYVEGVSLAYYVPSAPEVVIDLGVQIARALQYAHEREIIHRDIKPANIHVTPDGRVKIMDLGLALPREAKRVTAHGMVIGTPAYISPEQAQGLDLDHRTDIYSLGIVLYEIATGQLPFNADDITALLLQHVKQAPPPPRLIVSDLPMALENAILKALEKNPTRRFQSCAAFATAMQAALPQGRVHKTSAQEQVKPEGDTPGAGTPLNAPETVPSNRVRPRPTPQRTYRVILADDHTLLRRSLSSMLEMRDEYIVVAEAADGESALEQTVSILPDVLILDLNMPVRGGLDILPDVRAQAPQVKVLILTGRDEDALIMRALRAGAHGYLLKSAEESELIDAINRVTEGQLVLGKGVAEKVVGGMLAPNTPESERLDEIDQRILLHIAAGLSNDAIAQQLDIPQMTVIERLARIMDLLNAGDRHNAALIALRSGYILLEDLHALTTR